ncbi:MAG: hypothetical protein JO307_33840 [Bryobacterales bacterium]|nr:hypothetical protein [Bryobacterales bacterium]MBV9401061.1 hypothetical protein [Bryobacterales bacterium]
MTPSFAIPGDLGRDLQRWQRPALIAGGILLILSIIGAFFNPGQFFRSYLMGYLFWIGLALGSMALVMIQYLTGGAWGVVTRRLLESAMRTLPVLAVLFIPILIGIPRLYTWAHADQVRSDPVLAHRAPYMNPYMFIARAVVYFAAWLTFAYFLNKWSAVEDRAGDQTNRLAAISAPGLLVYVFTMTFASVDWAQSLVPHWFSTIWGFIFVVGQGLTAMSFAIVAVALFSQRPPLAGIVNPNHFHDLGKLLFMFIMLWGYMEFSQLLIVWSGNLTTEIPWYLPTFGTTWGWVGVALIVVQFLIPFLLLLSRPLKRNPPALCGVVAIIIVMRFVDLFWIVMPSYHLEGFHINWMNFSVPLALGGLWIAAFLWQLQKRPLLPLGAPNLEQAIDHGED